MKIIGCNFHPSYQQIAVLDSLTGEMVEKALSHERKEEVRAFYAGLEGSVRVGIEASGQSQWFSGCWRLGTRCGLGIRRRFAPVASGSRRPTGEMRSCC
jgi:hypothetical protein